MISMSQWRASIGSFHSRSTRNTTDKGLLKASNISICHQNIFKSLNFTIMCSMLISTLLLIGGIELNPGPTDTASDSQCKCNRKLGSSEIFKQRVSAANMQQKSTSQTISTNQYIIMEDMKKKFHILDPQTGKNIFEAEFNLLDQMSKRIQAEYDDIFSGKEDKFVSIPSKFQYNEDMTVSIKGLEERIQKEKCADKDYSFNSAELKRMENVLKNMKGDVTENQIHIRLQTLWHNKRGALFHSFHPEAVLHQLVDRAKAQRKSAKTLEFTTLEKKISEILSIDSKSEAKAIIALIKSNNPGITSFTTNHLLTEIDRSITSNKLKSEVIKDMTRIVSKNMKMSTFTIDESEKIISLGLFYHISKIAGEMDLIAILPDDKVLFNFEVKFQIADKNKSPTKLLNSATEQTKNNEEYLSRLFGPILTKGWRLIKVPVIIQSDGKSTLDPNLYCAHCKKFIIDANILSDLSSWINQFLPTQTTRNTCGLSVDYIEYLRVAEIIISSLSTESHLSAWKIVQGKKFNLPVAAGYTEIQGTFGLNPKKATKIGKNLQSKGQNISSPDEISFDEALHKFHDAQKLIFFSKLQLTLLDVSYHINMLLWSDYGTGECIIIL